MGTKSTKPTKQSDAMSLVFLSHSNFFKTAQNRRTHAMGKRIEKSIETAASTCNKGGLTVILNASTNVYVRDFGNPGGD